jgi:hypothetical protein
LLIRVLLRCLSGDPLGRAGEQASPTGGEPLLALLSHPVGVTQDHPLRGDVAGVPDSSYEFRIKGRLSDSVTDAFQDFTTSVKPAETIVRGDLRDQAELHGVLERIRSLGLELIEVRRLDEPGGG